MSLAVAGANASEKVMSPLAVVLTLILFVIVGFMLINAYYWNNVRDEHQYRVKRWAERQQQGRLGQD